MFPSSKQRKSQETIAAQKYKQWITHVSFGTLTAKDDGPVSLEYITTLSGQVLIIPSNFQRNLKISRTQAVSWANGI